MKRSKLEFSSHSGNLALMRKYVRKFLEPYQFTQKEQTLMVLGVDEACTNIIRYAYQLRDDQLIILTMEGLRDCVRMQLRDYGLVFLDGYGWSLDRVESWMADQSRRLLLDR